MNVYVYNSGSTPLPGILISISSSSATGSTNSSGELTIPPEIYTAGDTVYAGQSSSEYVMQQQEIQEGQVTMNFHLITQSSVSSGGSQAIPPMVESTERAPCPVFRLAGLARVVQADQLRQLRELLAVRFPRVIESRGERGVSAAEAGQRIILEVMTEPELRHPSIKSTLILGQADPRFRFVNGLPRSAGYGAAIGRAVQTALYGGNSDQITVITALLNVYMTMLDGLLDHVPEIIAPHLDSLLTMVCDGAAGQSIRQRAIPEDHPGNASCFLIAKLWVRKFQESLAEAGVTEPSGEIVASIRSAMLAEYENCRARFGRSGEISEEALCGRTRWPHWTQALVCTQTKGWPGGVDPQAFQQFVFRAADFLSYLDDLFDYVPDCLAGQWNTVSWAVYGRHPLTYSHPPELQRHLLTCLADDRELEQILQDGLRFREGVGRSLSHLSIPTQEFQVLIGDLTAAYLA